MSGQHGFARTLKWELDTISSDKSSCTLKLVDSEATMKVWPHKFKVLYTVSLHSKRLNVRFEVRNCDTDPFEFTALLHTYFNVESIKKVSIDGLGGLDYSDKLQNNSIFTETRTQIVDINEEVDRNFFNVPGSVKMTCPTGNFRIKSDFKDLGMLKL
jgi:glucose-6-phosphate 1-epimerase